MAEKVSVAAERPRAAGSSCSGSSSGSETLSEEGEPGGGAAVAPGAERASRGGRADEDDASLEERDEELDHILSPPPMPFRKSSNPEVLSGPGRSFKYKRQLSEDGRQLRRGSLGGALTGKYLLPNGNGQQLWQPAETSNLVRMRCQALGQSAPSLTVSSEGAPQKSHFGSARHRQRLVEPAASKGNCNRGNAIALFDGASSQLQNTLNTVTAISSALLPVINKSLHAALVKICTSRVHTTNYYYHTTNIHL